jgi:hypothetical protein
MGACGSRSNRREVTVNDYLPSLIHIALNFDFFQSIAPF